MYNPKISTIQPIYCEFIYNSVSNNNCLSLINMKNYFLTDQLNKIENITYSKVSQSHINRIKIYFSDEFKK